MYEKFARGDEYAVTASIGQEINLHSQQLGGGCTIRVRFDPNVMTMGDLVRLRHMIWKQNSAATSAHTILDEQLFQGLLGYRLPSFEERCFNILDLAWARSGRPGQAVNLFEDDQRRGIAWQLFTIIGAATGPDNAEAPTVDLRFYLRHLVDVGWLRSHPTDGTHFYVEPKGLMEVERRRRTTAQSMQGFIAMWFDDSTSSAYVEGIAPAIADAGYTAFRVDKHDHGNRIDDEIVAQIRQSRFLVADFTCAQVGQEARVFAVRGGVYFEAGLAQGLGIPVFWTAREDCLEGLHFDTRQFPHILWTEPQQLRTDLHNKIIARLGPGPAHRLG